MLIGRTSELAELNGLLHSRRANFIGVSGRRRLGKTTLLVEWARQSGAPYLYWVASNFPAGKLLAELSKAIYQHGQTGAQQVPDNFSYNDWMQAFEQLAQVCRGSERKHIVILDEFPYAVESEPGLPSVLQSAWDHSLKDSNVCLVLCGSQVSMMEALFGANQPLYNRIKGPLRLRPLPFTSMASFFPDYSFEDWVDAYAVLGGVPAYAEEFDPAVPLFENVRNNIFRETGIFRSDPELLIGEQVRDAKTYHAILEAIANGARQPAEIATLADIGPRVDISPYLVRLSEMDYLRSELPVSVPPEKHPQSRRTHYLITDAYLRFFFRFIRPSLPQLAQGLYDIVESRLKSHFKAFVGVTAFEEICREDVRIRSRQGRLPFQVENVGSHWSGGEGGERSQVDVAAINWKERCILLGEVKWTDAPLEANVVADLVGVKTENTLAVLNGTKKGGSKGEHWQVSYALFSRSGFTRPAAELARQSGAVMVEVKELREDFGV